jgi:hypothetical protein
MVSDQPRQQAPHPTASDHLGAGGLIGPYHLAQLFRVELADEHGRVHEITKQHGELAPFRLWKVRSSCGDITVEEVSFLECRRCRWEAW